MCTAVPPSLAGVPNVLECTICIPLNRVAGLDKTPTANVLECTICIPPNRVTDSIKHQQQMSWSVQSACHPTGSCARTRYKINSKCPGVCNLHTTSTGLCNDPCQQQGCAMSHHSNRVVHRLILARLQNNNSQQQTSCKFVNLHTIITRLCNDISQHNTNKINYQQQQV